MTDLTAAGAVTLAGAPFADDLGPAKVLSVHDATLGLDAALVVDNVARGPVTPAAERALHERGVLVIPDFIANAGGVICAAMEYHGATQAAAFTAIEEKIRGNTTAVLDVVRGRRISPREAALGVAVTQVRRAMTYRRFSTL
jgi:glutamate dehydrogenase (NAD(P)+)